jgi:HSP20 family protein
MLTFIHTDSVSHAPGASWATLRWGGEIDIYETDTSVVARISVPGVRPEQLDLQEHDGMLAVRVEQANDRRAGQALSRKIQIWERRVRLPVAVWGERAEAALKDGVLTITLPKVPEAQPRHIPVNGVQSRPRLAEERPGWLARLKQWLHWSGPERATASRAA